MNFYINELHPGYSYSPKTLINLLNFNARAIDYYSGRFSELQDILEGSQGFPLTTLQLIEVDDLFYKLLELDVRRQELLLLIKNGN